jgi:hypothetical protein
MGWLVLVWAFFTDHAKWPKNFGLTKDPSIIQNIGFPYPPWLGKKMGIYKLYIKSLIYLVIT